MTRAAFLDRDGTVIAEVNYLARPEQVRVLPGVPDALRRLRAAGYRLVLITNQAGVARGYFGEDDVAAVHAHLEDTLGLRFDAIRHCPHHPDGVVPGYARACACRKPGTAMYEDAIAALRLDPAASFAAGDKRTDLVPAAALGIPAFLVRTGHGAAEAPGAPFPVHDDLPAVVDAVLGARAPGVPAKDGPS